MRFKHIVIDFIPQSEQRIPGQVGDYGETDDAIWFRITDMGNENYNIACLIHEIWEQHRNKAFGIIEADIDAFDIAHQDHDDPGMLPDAPYGITHREADVLERMCIVMSGENWRDYDSLVAKITSGTKGGET
jgi:hypothetical protein